MHNLSGSGVTPPQCSPRPSRQRRDAGTLLLHMAKRGPVIFRVAFVQSNLIYLKIDGEEGGREKRKSRAFPSGHHVPIQESSRLAFCPPSFPSPKKAKDQWEGTGHLGARGYCMATTRPLPVIRAVSSAQMVPGVGCWASVCLVGPQWSSGPYWLYCSRANHETAPLQNQQQQRQPQK